MLYKTCRLKIIIILLFIILPGCKKENPPSSNNNDEISVRTAAIGQDGFLYIGTADKKIYRSLNNGESWTFLCAGPEEYPFYYLAVNAGGHYFIGNKTWGNLLYSRDSGFTWTLFLPGFEVTEISGFTINVAGHYFLRTDDEIIYRSTDGGQNWTAISESNMGSSLIEDHNSDAEGRFFAYIQYRTLYLTSDTFGSWTQVDFSSGLGLMKSVALNGTGHIFIGTYDNGLYRSTDNGVSWTNICEELADTGIYDITINSAGTIFIVPENGRLFRSSDNGDTWTELVIEE